jgi:transcription elongation factor Elf1
MNHDDYLDCPFCPDSRMSLVGGTLADHKLICPSCGAELEPLRTTYTGEINS